MRRSTLTRSLVVGVCLLSTTLTLAIDPIGQSLHEVERAASWVVPSEAILEVGWLVGAGVMLSAFGVGLKLRDLRRPRALLAQVGRQFASRKAIVNREFWFGYSLNLLAAVGEAAVAIVGICAYLPILAWGNLCVPIIDLVVTIVLRKTLLDVSRARRGEVEPTS